MSEANYKLRITIPESEITKKEDGSYSITSIAKEQNRILEPLLKKYFNRYVLGWENLDSKGQPTHLHYHIHFTSHHEKETIRKALLRRFESYEIYLKGVAMYSFKQEIIIEEDRFFRYPLKQLTKTDLPFKLSSHFTTEWFMEQSKIAYDHWITATRVNVKKVESKENRLTQYDKIEKFLQDKKHIGYEAVVRDTVDYYLTEKIPLNSQNIKGYTLTYLLKNKQMTIDEYLKKTNIDII